MTAPNMDINIPHLTTRKNKDGSLRYYFFRRGQPIKRLPGVPNTVEFSQAYDRCLNWVSPAAAAYEGSFEWRCDQYMASSAFKSKAKATRDARKRIIASMMAERLDPDKPETFGQERFENIGIPHLEILRDRKLENPNAANERLKVLSQIYDQAKVKPNPLRDVDRLAVPKGGHATATDEDIAKYEAKHPTGAPALAMRILKAFGPRVSDLRILGRRHVKSGLLCFVTVKTGMLCELPIGKVALPMDRLTFLLSDEGSSYASDKALSQRVSKWFRQAGVHGVTAHGVRKWLATKMAENGATEYELMAWFGWNDPKEARPYVEAANRRKLAKKAGQSLTRKVQRGITRRRDTDK